MHNLQQEFKQNDIDYEVTQKVIRDINQCKNGIVIINRFVFDFDVFEIVNGKKQHIQDEEKNIYEKIKLYNKLLSLEKEGIYFGLILSTPHGLHASIIFKENYTSKKDFYDNHKNDINNLKKIEDLFTINLLFLVTGKAFKQYNVDDSACNSLARKTRIPITFAYKDDMKSPKLVKVIQAYDFRKKNYFCIFQMSTFLVNYWNFVR